MPVKSLREHKAAASCTHLHTVRAPSKHLVQRDADDLGVAVCRSESTHRILMWCGVSAHRRGMRRDTDVWETKLFVAVRPGPTRSLRQRRSFT